MPIAEKQLKYQYILLLYFDSFKCILGRKPAVHCGPQARAWTWTYSGEINFHKLLVGEHKLQQGAGAIIMVSRPQQQHGVMIF